MLAKTWHGMGLATEATQSVLDDAWGRYDIERLHAVVDTPNLPSRRVLERVGLYEKGPVEVYGSRDMLLFTADRPANRPNNSFKPNPLRGSA
jgi:RimJ/RimL family protein N-acetyltransferase